MIKLDTRDKKPKIYSIAVLTVILAVVVVLLALFGGEGRYLIINMAFVVYYLLVVLLLIQAFVRQIQYNLYSYNTIYYSGFALFVASLALTHVILQWRLIINTEANPVLNILNSISGSAKNYMLLSSPFIFLFAIVLFVSNLSLIRHEGRRFVNILGMILAVLMVGGLVFLYAIDFYVMGSQLEVMIQDLLSTSFSAIYLYLECMLIGAIIAGLIAAHYEPEKDKDFLIILGCGLRKDGTPTPLLKGRVDRALEFYKKQKEETGKELIFVTSGGQGPNEVVSESAAMKRYLMEQGIPESQIIEEDQSTDTSENMKFSKEKIMAVNPNGKVAFSTTNYHVFRSGLCARRVKMRAQGMGAATKWYFWPNAAVREFVGILTEHRVKQTIIIVSMLVIYAVMVYAHYQIH